MYIHDSVPNISSVIDSEMKKGNNFTEASNHISEESRFVLSLLRKKRVALNFLP